MIILDLVLKVQWYDMIKIGAKTCEYREIKKYWTQRLFKKPFTHVRFRRGYTKECMVFELVGIETTSEKNDLNLRQAYKINLGAKILQNKTYQDKP